MKQKQYNKILLCVITWYGNEIIKHLIFIWESELFFNFKIDYSCLMYIFQKYIRKKMKKLEKSWKGEKKRIKIHAYLTQNLTKFSNFLLHFYKCK